MAGARWRDSLHGNWVLSDDARSRGPIREKSSGLKVTYTGTDSAGVERYRFTAPHNGPGPQHLRVVRPTTSASGLSHNFLYVLPVQAGLQSDYGDGLEVLVALNVHNDYNVTVISPTFAGDPWYANNPKNLMGQQESFMTHSLVPWARRSLTVSNAEHNWLIGFSKSGIGAQTLILRHPGLFAVAASWDFPAKMASYRQYGASSKQCYGSSFNFKTYYRLTREFVKAHSVPFMTSNRMWIGGYQTFAEDVSDYDALLTSVGIKHTSDLRKFTTHRWDSGWVPAAVAALCEGSLQLGLSSLPGPGTNRTGLARGSRALSGQPGRSGAVGQVRRLAPA